MGKMTILDGAMGTMLQAAGLGLGERPEIFGMQHPEIVEQIHSCYIDAGSDVIYANTFGANAHKLRGDRIFRSGSTGSQHLGGKAGGGRKGEGGAGCGSHRGTDGADWHTGL